MEHVEPLIQPVKGRQAVLEFVKEQKATFPDSKIEIKRMVEEGDTIASEIVFSGTNSGPLRLPGSDPIPATNKHLSSRLTAVARFVRRYSTTTTSWA